MSNEIEDEAGESVSPIPEAALLVDPAPPPSASELDTLQAAVDRIQQRLASSAADDLAMLAETIRVEELIAAMREPDAPPPPPPPPPDPIELDRFWQRLGGPSLSGRSFRHGVFAVMGREALANWTGYMGHPPEVYGGNVTGYGGNVWLADTWAKIANQQPNFGSHPQTRDLFTDPPTPPLSHDTWFVVMGATLPFGCDLAEMIASARGQRSDWHKRMGENMRLTIERAGRDPRLTIGRFDWESWGQDTARRINTPGRIKNFLLAGGSIELDKDHMRAFYRAFTEGFGMEMPLAFSDAYQTSPGVPRPPYKKWIEAGVYKILCGSVHPNAERTRTRDAAWRMVHSLNNGMYTPGVIIAAARELRMPVAFLEQSIPPEIPACQPNIANCQFVYTQFGKLVNANSDIMSFVCPLGSGMASETRMDAAGEPIKSQYASSIRENRKWFGKILPAAAA